MLISAVDSVTNIEVSVFYSFFFFVFAYSSSVLYWLTFD